MSVIALKGRACVLTVDPRSNELTDLYLPDTELWEELLGRFGGNKMMVTIRAPHDYKRGLIMPPELVIEKLIEGMRDGTAGGLRDIVEDILDSQEEH